MGDHIALSRSPNGFFCPISLLGLWLATWFFFCLWISFVEQKPSVRLFRFYALPSFSFRSVHASCQGYIWWRTILYRSFASSKVMGAMFLHESSPSWESSSVRDRKRLHTQPATEPRDSPWLQRINNVSEKNTRPPTVKEHGNIGTIQCHFYILSAVSFLALLDWWHTQFLQMPRPIQM